MIHQILGGLANGGIYACVALALVMVYKSTHHINFAQGEMAMFSTCIAWALLQAGWSYWAAFGATAILSFLIGAAIHAVIIRRLASASPLTLIVVFIGLMVMFHSLAGFFFGPDIKQFPSPFPKDAWYASAYMSSHEVGVIAVTLLVVSGLFAFFRYTKAGLGMRAAAQDAASARLAGVAVGRMLMLGWGLAAAIGAVAGMLVAPVVFLDPNMMLGVLIYAFAAALVGGIDSPLGAIIGGFIVGVLENLMGAYVVGTELKLSVALILIVAVLIVRPAGLLGRVVVSRV